MYACVYVCMHVCIMGVDYSALPWYNGFCFGEVADMKRYGEVHHCRADCIEAELLRRFEEDLTRAERDAVILRLQRLSKGSEDVPRAPRRTK